MTIISKKELERCIEAVILNKRDGAMGQLNPNWYPDNFEYGNIKAEVQACLNTFIEMRLK